MIGRLGLAVVVGLLAGCGESPEEAYERGYDEGYDDGQYDVCKELRRVAPGLANRLSNCYGF